MIAPRITTAATSQTYRSIVSDPATAGSEGAVDGEVDAMCLQTSAVTPGSSGYSAGRTWRSFPTAR